MENAFLPTHVNAMKIMAGMNVKNLVALAYLRLIQIVVLEMELVLTITRVFAEKE